MESQVIEALRQVIATCNRPIIAIDGPAGSGKTTLAASIARELAAHDMSHHAIHMDDLYDGWSEPLSPELYSRINSVISAHRAAAPVEYSTYNWAGERFEAAQNYGTAKALIIEGVGAAAAPVRDSIDLAIWIEVASDVGLNRVLTREPYLTKEQVEGWQAMELAHFMKDGTKGAADITLTTNPE